MASLEDLTTDQLLERARQLERTSDMLQGLLKDPELRQTTLRGLKKLNPSLPIPEIDAADTVRAELEAERQKRAELEDRVRRNEITQSIKEDEARIRQRFGLTDADVVEIKKLMTDEHQPIPYWDRAAEFYVAQRKVAEPTPTSIAPPTYEMPDKDIWGKGIGNNAQLNKIAMEEATRALNEIRTTGLAGR